ncbi:MAG: restriction endonuclease, SacI family, partial [Acidobacteriota bacterium]|nr:restriction endonuclease, SacI family [Acidobacteriota bacterium]
NLNARSLQEGAEIPGSFDPRTLCRKAILPFERTRLEGALGLSPDPYVNNPVRVPLLTKVGRASKSSPEMWDKLCDVADAIEAGNQEFSRLALRQVLLEIYRKLGNAEIKYDVPLRASLATVVTAVERFSGEQSGGDRPLALAAALFQTVGQYFSLFTSIRRGKINASDKASGQSADIECVDAEGKIVMAVEVKDRALKIADLDEKLGSTREKLIEELFFVTARGNKQPEILPGRLEKEFSAGQNLYIFSLVDLTRSVLALAGEKSRRTFLINVGAQLDAFSDTKHRLAWKKVLQDS